MMGGGETVQNRIIIHVGPPKTGTTSLQQFFHANREKLLSNGVLYPHGLVSQDAHHEVPNLIRGSISRFEKWVPNARQMSLSSILGNYFDEMKLKGISTLILSSEDFANFNSTDYSNLIGYFDPNWKLELVFFKFNPENRLKSHENQYIKSGEFVDSKAREKILEDMYSVRRNFEVVVSALQSTVHWIDYESLKTPLEIYERILDLVLFSSDEKTLNDWTIPKKLANASIPLKQIELLNEFNRLNCPGRQFDTGAPLMYSGLFHEEFNRLVLFKKLIEESVERDELIQQRDAAIAERDLIRSSNSWKLLAPYRKLTQSLRQRRGR
jgi:hypothetical protein